VKPLVIFGIMFIGILFSVSGAEDITTGLYLDWGFDSVASTPTLYGTATRDNTTYYIGNASIKFIGDDAPAGMIKSSFINLNSGTANLWFLYNGTLPATTTTYTLFGGGNTGNINPQVHVGLRVNTTGMCEIVGTVAAGGAYMSVHTSNPFNCTNNEWRMMTWVDTTNIGTGRDFYIDSVKQNKTYTIGSELTNSRFMVFNDGSYTTNVNGVGAYVRNGATRYSFSGNIDEVTFWNRRLTDDQISFLYEYDLNLSYDFVGFFPTTNIKENTTLPVKLRKVDTSASCNFSVNSVHKESMSGLVNGTYFFNYTLDMGIIGYNNLSVYCEDATKTEIINKTIFVDNTVPVISAFNYTNLGGDSVLLNNTAFSIQKNISFNIFTNDTGKDYTLSINIQSPTNTTFFSDVVSNIEGYYEYNNSFDLDGELSGNYIMNVTLTDSANNIYFQQAFFNYSYAAVNVGIFAIRSSATNELLVGTNMTVQYIGEEYQEQKTTVNGYAYFNISFDTPTDLATINVFQTTGSDYSIVTKQTTIYNGIDNNITIYVTNTTENSKLINFKIMDETKMNLAGAILRILKREPLDNSYIPLTDVTVNPSGEASVRLMLDTEFYKFVVEYEGVNVYVSGFPVSINENTDTITLECVVEEPYSTYFSYFLGLQPVLSFYRTGNETGYYELVYLSEENVDICLKTHYFQNNVRTNYSNNCDSSSTSGIITSPELTVTRLTYFHAEMWADFDDDGVENKMYLEQVNLLGFEFEKSEKGRLLIYIGLIVLCGFGFVYNPTIGLITLIIGLIVIAATHFTLIGTTTTMLIVGLTVFVLVTLNKNKGFER
jgi:hypothetical protein